MKAARKRGALCEKMPCRWETPLADSCCGGGSCVKTPGALLAC